MESQMDDTGGDTTYPDIYLPLLELEERSQMVSSNCMSFLLNLTNVYESEIPGLAGLCNASLFSTEEELHENDHSEFHWIQVLVHILYGIIFFIGFSGNTLVIYVVARFSKMRTATNMIIMHLALADMCLLVTLPFLMTAGISGYWEFGRMGCKVYFILSFLNQITSPLFLLILSVERYLSVCHPVRATKWISPVIATLVSLIVWMWGTLNIAPIYMYAETLEIDGTRMVCNIFWPQEYDWLQERVFLVYWFISNFVVPLIFILIFNMLVIRKLWVIGSKPTRPSPSLVTGAACNRNCGGKKHQEKVTKLVLTVITIYFLCWAPYWGMQMIYLYSSADYSEISQVTIFLLLFAGCLSCSNSAMNPIIYAVRSENYKRSFVKAVTCARVQKRNVVLQTEDFGDVALDEETAFLGSNQAFNESISTSGFHVSDQNELSVRVVNSPILNESNVNKK